MAEKKAIVIGAGIVGLATARALALKGFQVEVFERTMKSVGASIRNFGMIWPIGQPSGTLYHYATRSAAIWKEIADQGGLWYDAKGSLHLAYNKEEWQVLNELYETFSREGRKVKLLSAGEAMARSPLANPKGCLGGLFSEEELIVDPRQAIAFLPLFFNETLGIQFHWGRAVRECMTGAVVSGNEIIETDLIFICGGADFETLYPEVFSKYPLTRCKLQMMRLKEDSLRRMGPALCGGLSLTHYKSFEAAPSLELLRKKYREELPEYLEWGIHVMVSQHEAGELTIGDSHEYGLSPDPFDKKIINDLILKYLAQFTVLEYAENVETWNGVYGKFTNGQTELFISPEPGVYILNGVGGAGMTLSFGMAEEKVGPLL